jgi:hypothetical protein
MRLGISAASASTEIAKEPSGARTVRRSINFAVYPQYGDEIRLATGEVFCAPGADEHKSKATGYLTVIESDAGAVESESPWEVSYHEPWRDDDEGNQPAGLSFYVFLNPREYAELLSNACAENLPDAIGVHIGKSEKWKYGWEPDATTIEWDNREKPAALPIESISFHYKFSKAETEARSILAPESSRQQHPVLELRAPDRLAGRREAGSAAQPAGRRMVARFGQVTYWFFCIVAAIVIAAGIEQASSTKMTTGEVLAWGGGVLSAWLVGRAFLYVLAGR